MQTRASLGLPDAVILDGRDPANYVIAEEAGLFEGLLEPGRARPRGRPGRAALVPRHAGARAGGAARAARRRARRDPRDPVTEPGDSVFTLGQPIEAAALL